jgi:photosystem II stability/assembly factor-like uncharacterized protein
MKFLIGLFTLFALASFGLGKRILVHHIAASPNPHVHPNELYLQSKFFSSEQKNHELLTTTMQQELAMLHKQTRGANLWQLEGPHNIGGRINTLAIHPTNNNILLVGTPNGGIFKSTNGGASWAAVFDNQTCLTISSIAFDPSNPNIVYAGTGDNALGGRSYLGNGVFKSTDAGTTWAYLGLSHVQLITKIIVDPNNANHLIVGAAGNMFTRDQNRGVFESVNGGASWVQTLLIDSSCGVGDIIINPQNAKTIYVTGRYRFRSNMQSIINGPKTKIYKTINGGASWDTIMTGIPLTNLCKIGLAISAQDTNKLYANIIDSNALFAGVFKTINGGNSWTQQCGASALTMNNYGWYFGEIKLNPTNDNIVYVLSIDLWRSSNGGATFTLNAPPWYTYEVHADHHDLQFVDSNTYYSCNDGGIYKTTDGGTTWTNKTNMPISQFYKVNYNAWYPDMYFGGAQDNGTTYGNQLGLNVWARYFGGDGFLPLFSDSDPQSSWVEIQNGGIYYTYNGGGNFSNITQSVTSIDRTNWNTPYAFDLQNTQQMLMGTYRMWLSLDNTSNSWLPISGDLTDGPTSIDDSGFHTISTIAQSSLNTNYLYAGTSDANVWVSNNYGTSWQQINAGLPNQFVTCIQPSLVNAQTIYASFSGYRNNDSTSYIYKSTNNGSTWQSIANNLPPLPINDIYIHPNTKDSSIVVATDGGIYATANAGAYWKRVGDNLPFVPVFDIEFNPITNRLFAATHAIGIISMGIDSVFTLTPKVNVGIDNTSTSVAISLFPNPVQQQLNFSKSNFAEAQYFITNGYGVTVSSGTFFNQQSIDASAWSNGMYTLCITENGHQQSRQFLVMH